ncbi:MAG: SDR family oxidoreductase [Deltaproteobacteria bacterium]|nr:SDR family oxidoreductase [Deltaproteobacteria bacterium]
MFITGASSGFGAACARIFAQHGNRLILSARRVEKMIRLREELSGLADIHVVGLDVRDREAVRQAISVLPEAFKDIDVLINNAGLALGLEPANEVNLDDWDEMVDTNIKGLMYCTRFVLPGMIARNRGHIVNVSSTAASWPYPGGNAYGGCKAFVLQFSRNLRADLLGKPIRVSCIQPGMAETEFSDVRFKGDKQSADSVYRGTTPLVAQDIAEAIKWIVDRPAHVNINNIELMCVDQAWGHLAVNRAPANKGDR